MAIQPKYYFAKADDFTKSWPLPAGFYMLIYYVPDKSGALVETAFSNVKVTAKDFAYYDKQGKLLKADSLDWTKANLLDGNILAEGTAFGFVPLAKDPAGTPGQAGTPTPAYLLEQGQPVGYVFDNPNNLSDPVLFPPPDGDYKVDFYDSKLPNAQPVSTTVYTVKQKGFTEYKIDAKGNLTSSSVVATDDVKKAIQTQISKGGKVVFTTIKLTVDDGSGGKKDEKKGMSPLLIGALVVGGIYLLTRKKGE